MDPRSQQKPSDQPSEQHHKTTGTRRRRRYVTRACARCQRRKIRCSGSQPCDGCRDKEQCVYPEYARRSRKPQSGPRSCSSASSSHSGPEPGPAAKSSNGSMHFEQVSNRLDELEDRLKLLDPYQAFMTPAGLLNEEQPPDDSTFSWLAGSFAQDTPCAAAVSSPVPLPTPKTVTSRDSDSDASNPCNQGLGLTSEFPACCQANLMVGVPETMDTGLAYQHCMFRVYFEGPNTHYPCIDEADFISRFEALARLGRKVPYTSEALQMLALVNIILAVVRALEGEGSPHEEYPGWSEYRRGNHFLRHVLWSGQLDLLMVQSLVLKSSYLLYIEQPHLAYDALSVATRVIYQMGLHNESQWADTNQSEIVVYRRVLWSCYCLDRVVAVACGGPYHLQDADMTVGEPSAADDRQASTTAGPVAGNEGSPTPSAYLRELVHWARLYFDISGSILVQTRQTIHGRVWLGILDQKILTWANALPTHFAWQPGTPAQCQALSLYLRHNHLRILIRHEYGLKHDYSSQIAEECVNIAADTMEALTVVQASVFGASERYTSTSFVAAALLALIAVLLAEDTGTPLFVAGGKAFVKGVEVLDKLCGGLRYTQHTRRHLEADIQRVQRRILHASEPKFASLVELL